jgi:hypothetical protein
VATLSCSPPALLETQSSTLPLPQDGGDDAVFEGVTREVAVGPRVLLNDLELLLVAERAPSLVTPRASLFVEADMSLVLVPKALFITAARCVPH